MFPFREVVPLKALAKKASLAREHASSTLDYAASMAHLSAWEAYPRQTKIMANIGPACRSVHMVQKMMEAGINIIRVMGTGRGYDYHAASIQIIRDAEIAFSNKIGRPYSLEIALNIAGPEIKTGSLEGGLSQIELKKGEKVKLTTDEEYKKKCNSQIIYVDYPNIVKVLKVNSMIYIRHGYICLVVDEIYDEWLYCHVKAGGIMYSKQAMNLPGAKIDLPNLMEGDKRDIQFAVDQEVDMLITSFIRTVDAMKEVRALLGEKGKDIFVVSKIENEEGLSNFNKIIQCADGIFIGRGDLGIEIPLDKVFLAQKSIVSTCNRLNKPVICSGQMMNSMIRHPRPSRDEVNDIANCVLDGVDCIVLAEETSKGDYPLEAIKILGKICREAESAVWRKRTFKDLILEATPPIDALEAVAIAVVEASVKSKASAIIVLTRTGRSAHLLCKYKPRCPIVAVTRRETVGRQLQAYKSIIPLVYDTEKGTSYLKDMDERVRFALRVGLMEGFLNIGDAVVIMYGWNQGLGFSNTLILVYLTEDMGTILF